MSFLLKDPSAALDYAVDWGRQYLDDDLLIESSWTVEPLEEGGVTVLATSIEERIARVTLAGGVAGKVYRVSNQVTTAAGRRDSRSLVLRMEVR